MKINLQPIEKLDRQSGDYLDVHSVFYTLQGEGPFCGTPAVFIRLAGCNLQCPGCDTDYTSTRKRVAVGTMPMLVAQQCGRPGCLVVITGGEPFRQNLAPLFKVLTEAGHYVQVETNGTLPPSPWPYADDIDKRKGVYVVCSPKTGRVNAGTHEAACCYKYVMEEGNVHPVNGLPMTALRHTAVPYVARPAPGSKKPVYLQPMDSQDPEQNERNRHAVVASALRHGYIVQLQVHKLLGLE